MQGDQYRQNKEREDKLPDTKHQPLPPFKRTDVGYTDFSSLFFLFQEVIQVQI
jgi:hypothetical protein